MSTVNYLWGAPRSGKTTFLAYLCRKELKKKHPRPVFANFPLKGATMIKDTDLGYYGFEGSLILLDESGLAYDCRNFKNGLFKDEQRLEWWKLAGHRKDINTGSNIEIWVASQGWNDIDLKIRTLAESYYLCKKCFPFRGLSKIRPVIKSTDIDPVTHEPTDYYNFDFFLFNKLIRRRPLYKWFDSYDCRKLPFSPNAETRSDYFLTNMNYPERGRRLRKR